MAKTAALRPIALGIGAFLTLSLAWPASAQNVPGVPTRPLAVAQPAPRPAQQVYPAIEVQMRDLAAIVRVTPERRSDIAVIITNTGGLPAPELRVSQRRLVIDGKLRRRIQSCHARSGDFRVDVRGAGTFGSDRLPQIELRVPENAVVSTGGAVRMTMSRAKSANVNLAGCGDVDIASVAENAEVAIAGGGDLRLFDAGSAEVRVAGGGDVTLGVIRNALTVSVAGGGDVTAARADGPTNIAVQGSGDVVIRDGRATTLSVAIAGSGDVRHGGEADRLDAAIVGSGDVTVRRVTGPVTRRVIGSGDIVVGQ